MDTNVEKPVFSPLQRHFEEFTLSTLAVIVLTGLMLAIGRETLGEGVIALFYLVPISWCAARWGRGPGIVAAATAALAFDFCFIPPFYTFTIATPEGWLILIIFLGVSVVIVDRIQSVLSQAKKRERDAIFMYELSVALANIDTPQGVAHILADKLQQLYQAELVQVTVEQRIPRRIFVISLPLEKGMNSHPDRVLPILAPHGMVGEICLWSGELPLPPLDDHLLRSFAAQGAYALGRVLGSQQELRQSITDSRTELG